MFTKTVFTGQFIPVVTKNDLIYQKVRYPCDQCDYKAKNVGNLKKHVESIHDGVCYTCDQCTYKATKKGHIKFVIHVINVTIRLQM